MEKAMYQSHGMSYEEYSRELDQRIEVEKRRERDYHRSLRIANEATRQSLTKSPFL